MTAAGGRAIDTVAVVGVGIIGRSWIRVFARAGCETRVFDPDPGQRAAAVAWLDEGLAEDVEAGFVSAADAEALRARVREVSGLEEALDGAGFVQESGPERLEVKRSIFRDMDRLAGADAILGSSASALDMTEIARGLPGAGRCIVTHPTNPPHVIPGVEVVPGAETRPEVEERTGSFLRSVGQIPISLNRFVPGYLMNRIQSAVYREAIHLVDEGVASVDAVDAVIRDCLGLRWALFGAFGTGNTNADGGIREYLDRYAESYQELMDDLGPTPEITPGLIEEIGRGVDAMEGHAAVPDLCRWRDRLVRRIVAARREDPHPGRPDRSDVSSSSPRPRTLEDHP